MKKLLNTLYVLTPESALFCRNENIGIRVGGTEETGGSEKLCVPAISIDAIVCFGRMSVSTPLLEFCGQRGISVTFLTDSGRFMGRFYGPVSGNVLLRKRQYETLDDPDFCCALTARFCWPSCATVSWYCCVLRGSVRPPTAGRRFWQGSIS